MNSTHETEFNVLLLNDVDPLTAHAALRPAAEPTSKPPGLLGGRLVLTALVAFLVGRWLGMF